MNKTISIYLFLPADELNFNVNELFFTYVTIKTLLFNICIIPNLMTFGKQTHAFKTICVLDILLITLLNFSYVYVLTFSNLQLPS